MKVDAENMKLKLSRCRGGVWYNNVQEVDLPDEVLDLSRIGQRTDPVRTDKAMNKDQDKEMETNSGEGEQLQG